MPAIESIALTDLELVTRVRDAPVGALIQTKNRLNIATVYLRSEDQSGQSQTPGIVDLEGDEVGQCILSFDVLDWPAIIVDALTDISVKDLGPYKKPTEIRPGLVCSCSGRFDGRLICMATSYSSIPMRVSGYVCLSGPKRGYFVEVFDYIVVGMASTTHRARLHPSS